MDSQLEPLVKLLACYYPKYHCTICIYWKGNIQKTILPVPSDIYLAMDQTDLAGSNWHFTNLVLMWVLVLQILKIQDRIACWTLQRSSVIRKPSLLTCGKVTMLGSISSWLERHEPPPPSHFPTSTPPHHVQQLQKQSLRDWLLDFSVLSLTVEA